MDSFGRKLPGFNLRGEAKAGTFCGGFTTLIILTIVLIYSTSKAIHLVNRSKQTISENLIVNNFEADF